MPNNLSLELPLKPIAAAEKESSLLARFDSFFWRSTVLKRDSMRNNHVSSHRYSNRAALGIYRIISLVLALILFGFLTFYESAVLQKRFYLDLAWWTSLLTVSFFGLTSAQLGAYFTLKPSPRVVDASHPFLCWKIVTWIYAAAMSGCLHLLTLVYLSANPYAKVEIVMLVAPFLLLFGDALLNRLCVPSGILVTYGVIAYSTFLVYISDIAQELKPTDPVAEF